MNCPRCTGLMVRDDFLDLQYEVGECGFVAWRCLICGEVLDPVILKHRSTRPVPMMSRARPQLQRFISMSARKDSDRSGDPWDDPDRGALSLVATELADLES